MKTRKWRGVCLAMAAVMTLTSLGFFGCGTSDEAYQLEQVEPVEENELTGLQIAYLGSSVFQLRRYADTATLPQSQDRTPRVRFRPLSGFYLFSCRLEASARGRWHRAGLLRRRGDYYLGCGRRRYCGRVCCLSRRRVLALPQCF